MNYGEIKALYNNKVLRFYSKSPANILSATEDLYNYRFRVNDYQVIRVDPIILSVQAKLQ